VRWHYPDYRPDRIGSKSRMIATASMARPSCSSWEEKFDFDFLITAEDCALRSKREQEESRFSHSARNCNFRLELVKRAHCTLFFLISWLFNIFGRETNTLLAVRVHACCSRSRIIWRQSCERVRERDIRDNSLSIKQIYFALLFV